MAGLCGCSTCTCTLGGYQVHITVDGPYFDFKEPGLEEDLERAEKAYLEARKQINIKINELRSRCDHSLVKYVPDASGNNDSFYYCLTCGLEKKRFDK